MSQPMILDVINLTYNPAAAIKNGNKNMAFYPGYPY